MYYVNIYIQYNGNSAPGILSLMRSLSIFVSHFKLLLYDKFKYTLNFTELDESMVE